MSLPPGSWDTHVHVFDPARFPYAPGRSYTPGEATVETLRRRHADWGVVHAVVVQPSVYGTDNACLLDALRALGPGARGVAVIDPASTGDEALADLAMAGVGGFRVNLVAGGGADSATPLRHLAERLRGTDHFAQFYAPLATVLACAGTIRAAGVPVVLDHFAGAGAAPAEADLAALARLCAEAPVWIKLSAEYRIASSEGGPDGGPQTPARDLIARFWAMIPDRLIWGSDWPHTGGGSARRALAPGEVETFRPVASLAVPRLMAEAGLDSAAIARVLTDNPRHLFRAPSKD